MTSYIFGPVPSRRLGRSLGLDLIPFKTCTYDCIYCQLGRTTRKTAERKAWVPLEAVLEELQFRLSSNPDYITLGGSGEPTLFSRLDELIEGIKAMTDIPVAVLTNSSLLWREDVREQLRDADLVVPSLDAGSKALFEKVNRPVEDVRFDTMVQGLIDFRHAFSNRIWLEILLVEGLTATEPAVAQLARWTARIEPDRVQLNTVTRPGAESFAKGVSREALERFAAMFTPPAEVVADFRGVHQRPEFAAGRDAILDLLHRRPCSIDDIAGGLGMHRNEVVKYVEELTAAGTAEMVEVGEKKYYRVGE
jgi:wyosine [tRNA(Phe)-imidazoG37] synthetase (radical SAM superfamily)